MRYPILLGSIALAFGAAFACSSSDNADIVDADGGADAGGSPGLPNQGPAGTGAHTGLPCDVQAVLENRCIVCHDGTRATAMLTYGDLVVPAKSDLSKTLAEVALLRMKDAERPMPPKPAAPPDADEIQVFEDWVKAGTPTEPRACTDSPPGGGASDAGSLADAGDGGACTSGTFWSMGNTPSPLMHPGMSCNACHAQAGGPNLRVAGTVYSALNETDDCNGKGPPPQLTVIVTAVDGREYSLPVNGSGNFALQTMRPKPPFRARVTDGTKTRAMVGSVTSGDCNSCHTVAGRNGAPGRILAP